MPTVDQIDKARKFVQSEAQALRRAYADKGWAQIKARTYDEVDELLTELRRSIQMTGMGGKKIE